MRNLLLLSALGLLGYLGYRHWFAEPVVGSFSPLTAEISRNSVTARQEAAAAVVHDEVIAIDAFSPEPRAPDRSADSAPAVDLFDRKGAIEAAHSLAAVLRRDIARLSVEINHFGTKLGAKSLRAPVSLRNKKAALEHQLGLLLVELQALRDPRASYPANRLRQYEAGDFSSIPDWSR